MLVLSNVHKLLARALVPPELHTAVLLTPAGQLVSCAADPARCKDDVRAIVGLSGEKWQEAGDRGVGMESPFGRIMVLAVEAPGETGGQDGTGEPRSTVGGGKDEDKGEGEGAGAGEVASEKPLMLVALNATSAVEWDVLEAKASPASRTDFHSLPRCCVSDLTLTRRVRRSQGRELAGHLARPIGKIRAPLAAAMAVPAAPATTPSRLPR